MRVLFTLQLGFQVLKTNETSSRRPAKATFQAVFVFPESESLSLVVMSSVSFHLASLEQAFYLVKRYFFCEGQISIVMFWS